MADHDIQCFELIMSALRDEAGDCFEEPALVTIDFGRISGEDPSGGNVRVERLKASRRVAFLKAELFQDERLIFTAKAVFKAGSGLE